MLPIWGAAIVGSVSCAVTIMNYSGFCWDRNGFLSDVDLIDIATESYFSVYPPNRYVGMGALVGSPIEYASHENFRDENPDCCEIIEQGRKGQTPSLSRRIAGEFRGFVRITYRLEQENEDRTGLNTVFVALTNCGTPWNGIRL